MLLLDWVPKRPLGVEAVTVPSPVATAGQIAGLHEFIENRLRGAIGYPDGGGNVAYPRVRIPRHIDQRMAMVRENGPADC